MELSKTENKLKILDRVQDLTPNQKACYDFIVYKLNAREVISRNDIIKAYKEKVLTGKFYYDRQYNRLEQRWEYVKRPSLEKNEVYEIRPAALNWFKTNIGALVVKGKFIVLPLIDIEE